MSAIIQTNRESQSRTSGGDSTLESDGHTALQQADNSFVADAQPELREMLNRSPKVQTQLRIKHALSQSPKAQSLTQARQMLNQRPNVLAQTKLATALNSHNGASRQQTLQRQAAPEEEETAQLEARPGASAGLTVQRKLTFQQFEAIHKIFADTRKALWDIQDALDRHKITRDEAHDRYMRLSNRLEAIDTDGYKESENQRVELMDRVLEEAEANLNATEESARQEQAAPAETIEITRLAREGKLNDALLRLSDAFGLNECPVRATDNYADVLPPGTHIPAGIPFGVTVGGPRQPGKPPVVVYIHNFWIRRWLLDSDQIGNLVDTIRHEQTHAKQRKDPNFAYDANEDVKEFEAYAAEVVTAQDRINNNAIGRMRPTEPAIRFAVERAREHFLQMGSAERLSFQAQLDQMNDIWTRLQPILAASDDARNATAADISGFRAAYQQLRQYRLELDVLTVSSDAEEYRTLSDKADAAWKLATSYYNGISINSRNALAVEHQTMEDDYEEFLAYRRRRGPRPRPVVRAAAAPASAPEGSARSSLAPPSLGAFKIAPPPSASSSRSRVRPATQPVASNVSAAAPPASASLEPTLTSVVAPNEPASNAATTTSSTTTTTVTKPDDDWDPFPSS